MYIRDLETLTVNVMEVNLTHKQSRKQAAYDNALKTEILLEVRSVTIAFTALKEKQLAPLTALSDYRITWPGLQPYLSILL